MNSTYVTFVPKTPPKVLHEISPEQFNSLKTARESLTNVLYIEEKFNFIVDNFMDLEQDLLQVTLNAMYFPKRMVDWTHTVTEIHLINRRIINFLTTSKLYLDQVTHDLNTIPHEIPNLKEDVKDRINNEYNSVLGYRVMEALRNYVQHRGLPVHVLSYTSNRSGFEGLTEELYSEHSVSPLVNLDDLEKDGKFKRAVLDELISLGGKIHIKNYIRQYVHSLGNIQSFIRHALEDKVRTWDAAVSEAFLPHITGNDELNLLCVAEKLATGFTTNRMYLRKDVINRRRWLEMKNSDLQDLAYRIASTKLGL